MYSCTTSVPSRGEVFVMDREAVIVDEAVVFLAERVRGE